MLQIAKIDTIVSKIQKVYFILACLGFALAIFVYLGLFEKYGFKDGVKLTYATLIYFAIYFGLIRRKKWIIPLIQIFTALGLFWELIYFLQPVESIGNIVGKAISVLLIIFYGYQIHFFSKTEVKNFFRSKGSVLFCSI